MHTTNIDLYRKEYLDNTIDEITLEEFEATRIPRIYRTLEPYKI